MAILPPPRFIVNTLNKKSTHKIRVLEKYSGVTTILRYLSTPQVFRNRNHWKIIWKDSMKKEYFSVSESVWQKVQDSNLRTLSGERFSKPPQYQLCLTLFMAGNEGLEPTTHRLTADCSTIEPISHFYSHTTELTYIHSPPQQLDFSHLWS